ncbi:ATP-binding cassette (ABC) Superfamily [Phytophthora palmivora]|uniref:ATP-binding cassette (ABC) Superfamily n=1 Tax=Phytophthora palmivora TaxID=4796 RepID=A0A2P4YIZ7_9STRA|nr:ATP-binding cassette (ABC) Superfamily [Phytophthora palmivora]
MALCCSLSSSWTNIRWREIIPPRDEHHLIKDVPLFLENIETARLRKKSETKGGLHPVWGLPWVQLENTSSAAQVEALFWSWVSCKGCPVKEQQTEAQLEFILIQRDLRVQFAHLVTKRQLVTEMESALSRSSGSREFWTRCIPATSLAAGASRSAAALGRHAPHESGAHRADQEGQTKTSLVFEYEARSQSLPPGLPPSGPGPAGSFLQDEVRQLLDRIYAIEIALDIGLGCQAAAQSGKPTALRQIMDALGHEARELHGRVDRRVPASALKELRRSLDALAYEAHALKGAHPVRPQRALFVSRVGANLRPLCRP